MRPGKGAEISRNQGGKAAPLSKTTATISPPPVPLLQHTHTAGANMYRWRSSSWPHGEPWRGPSHVLGTCQARWRQIPASPTLPPHRGLGWVRCEGFVAADEH